MQENFILMSSEEDAVALATVIGSSAVSYWFELHPEEGDEVEVRDEWEQRWAVPYSASAEQQLSRRIEMWMSGEDLHEGANVPKLKLVTGTPGPPIHIPNTLIGVFTNRMSGAGFNAMADQAEFDRSNSPGADFVG